MLRWPNHERERAGGTFLWTARGIPVALCDISVQGERATLGFHSLTQEPILVEIEGRVVQHRAAGVELVPVPGLPPAASTAAIAPDAEHGLEFQAATLDANDKDAEQFRL